MTIGDYIEMKFQSFDRQLSEADLFDIWPEDTLSDLTSENKPSVEIAIAQFIPQFIIRSVKTSEGSNYSVSFDIQAIKDYYSFLCKKYGLDDSLNIKADPSAISDASDNW